MAKDENKESEIRGDEQEIVDQRLPVWRPQDADREYYRYETKKRIQHYTVPPQTIFRPAKPTPTIRDAEHQQFILEQMEQDKIILIRGNHEDLFVELVTTDAGMPYSYHKSNGTYDTALQLTGFDPVMASIRHYDFADAAKDTPFYKEIIPAMLDYFETEHYVFTHGWIPSIPNRDKSYSYISSWREADREQWNQARWFNGMDAAQTADENKTIVCGHWHTSYGHSKYEHKGTEFGEDADFSPYYGPGIIAIDACTAFSGKVNCLVIED